MKPDVLMILKLINISLVSVITLFNSLNLAKPFPITYLPQFICDPSRPHTNCSSIVSGELNPQPTLKRLKVKMLLCVYSANSIAGKVIRNAMIGILQIQQWHMGNELPKRETRMLNARIVTSKGI